MNDRTPVPDRIDLRKTDDPRDAVHRAVATLAQGGTLRLGLKGLSGSLAAAQRPEALPEPFEAGASGRPREPWTLLIRGASELADWVPELAPVAERLARRGWPGPLSLVFPESDGPSLVGRLTGPVRDGLRRPEGLSLRVPEARFVLDVLRLIPGPLVYRPGSVRPERLGGEEDRDSLEVVEGEPPPRDLGATEVALSGKEWKVLRAGPIEPCTLGRLSATMILFVCTGNTCRSPMAEALCKVLLAERLGCGIDDLEGRGYVVLSAGIAVAPGMPAAGHAARVAEFRGGSLKGHASRPLSGDLVRFADHILTMTGDHLEALLSHMPDAAPRARLLHPQGDDVPDPVGADLDVYRRTATAIESYLVPWLDTLPL